MSTVSDLLEADSLERSGVVRWGKQVANDKPGVYIVSLSSDLDENNCLTATAPINHVVIEKWLRRVPEFKLDGELNPSPEAVAGRLSEYWLPDESILYIGQTSRAMQSRLNQFYKHKLGNSSPHRGGHWLKTLSVLNETFVHYAETPDPELSEYRLMRAFMVNASVSTRNCLRDSDQPYPFGNLELPRLLRQTGITKPTL